MFTTLNPKSNHLPHHNLKQSHEVHNKITRIPMFFYDFKGTIHHNMLRDITLLTKICIYK